MSDIIDLRKKDNELDEDSKGEPAFRSARELKRESLYQEDSLPWQAYEFTLDAQQKRLLRGAAILLGGGALAAIIFENFPFAALLAVSGGLLALHSSKEPKLLDIAVTGQGIQVGKKFYPFEQIESFWIEYDPVLFKELLLVSKRKLMPLIRIPLGNVDHLQLREILLGFLKEQKYEETLLDVVSKRLGF